MIVIWNFLLFGVVELLKFVKLFMELDIVIVNN